jgi:hypothetical protein
MLSAKQGAARMSKPTIPHAEDSFVDRRSAAPREILHVVSKLMRRPSSPGFDAGKKLEMERAAAHAQADIDPGCAAVFHYADDEPRRRPTDLVGNAVHIMKVLTGEADDEAPVDDGKDLAAKALGAKGGAARAKSMTPERRAEIAKAAAAKRWGK